MGKVSSWRTKPLTEPHSGSQGLFCDKWYQLWKTSEGGEAIARAVHGLKDIGAGTDEDVDVRSEDHNDVEIKLNDDGDEKPTNFKTAKTKTRDKYDQIIDDLSEEDEELEDDVEDEESLEEELNEIFGYVEVDRTKLPILNILSKLYYECVQDVWKVDSLSIKGIDFLSKVCYNKRQLDNKNKNLTSNNKK